MRIFALIEGEHSQRSPFSKSGRTMRLLYLSKEWFSCLVYILLAWSYTRLPRLSLVQHTMGMV